MTVLDIIHHRLLNQQIAKQTFEEPSDVVSWMGAMQAQDYPGALWSVGLRTLHTGIADVEQAIVDRKIVRTWPMRGTLHFVAAEDVRWMLNLMTPRIVAATTTRQLNLGLNDDVFATSRKLLVKALRGGTILTRNEMCEVLEQGNIATTGQRGIHIFWRLAQEGLICFGPHSGKQPTFVLLDEWVPQSKILERDEALAELAKRYFTSHGPATLHDLARWSGLKVSDARVGIDLAAAELAQQKVEGTVFWMSQNMPDLPIVSPMAYLLPGFDEYMLGYKDRSAALDPQHAQKIVPGSNGMFIPTIIIDGRVAGIWKRVFKKKEVVISLTPFSKFDKAERQALEAAAQQYGRFIGLPVTLI